MCPGSRAVANHPAGATHRVIRLDDGSCSLRPHGCGLGLRVYSLSGPPRVHFRYGPRTRPHPEDEVVEGLQDLWLPSGLPSQLRGLRLLPRQVYLLLNTSAFPGRTTGRADFPHPALIRTLKPSHSAWPSDGRESRIVPVPHRGNGPGNACSPYRPAVSAASATCGNAARRTDGPAGTPCRPDPG
jgi:hypothetical protein